MELPLRVVPIAWTSFDHDSVQEWMKFGFDSPRDELAEFAGRACYESWDRPNPSTASNMDYMAHILEVGHESVLEHSSVTFYARDVSRSLTHELVRHRHLSYSQRSQRYVDEYNNAIIVPPDIRNNPRAMNLLLAMGSRTKIVYKELVNVLSAGDNGLPRKRARSAARAVLLGSQSTAIVVTGNLRAWRDFLKKRYHVAADEEIQQFAQAILYHLREIAPHSVQDIPATPYGTV